MILEREDAASGPSLRLTSRRLMTLVAVALAAVMLVTLAPSVTSAAVAPPATYSPSNGVWFNNPFGRPIAKHTLNNRMDRAINSTRAGATVRISMYSFSRHRTAKAIIAAYRRGVNVRVLLNDHQMTPAMQRLIRVLGTNVKKPSFIHVCKDGCRVRPKGNNHAKFLTFTDVNGVPNVTMVTSGNLTINGGAVQWNDLMIITRRQDTHDAFAAVFDQMSADKRVVDSYRFVKTGPYQLEFFPISKGSSLDPYLRDLNKVRCRGVAPGAGRGGRTVVRVVMWTWAGKRGMAIAKKLRSLDNAGCHVEVIVGAPSAGPLRELRRPGRFGGVAIRDSRRDYSEDYGFKGAHQKYILIDGRYGNDPRHRRVITGSMNMTGGALTHGDEVMVQVPSRRYWRQYTANFNLIWRNWARPLSHY